MKKDLCDDHFQRVSDGKVCGTCPFKADNRSLAGRLVNLDAAMDKNEAQVSLKLVLDTVGNIEGRLGTYLSETRKELLEKFDKMQSEEKEGHARLYKHIDESVEKAFNRLTSDLDRKAATADLARLEQRIDKNDSDTAKLVTDVTRLIAIVGMASSFAVIVLGGFIAYLFSVIPK